MVDYVRSPLGAQQQLAKLFGLPPQPTEGMTLNTLLDIHADELFEETDDPVAKYITFGIGGHKVIDNGVDYGFSEHPRCGEVASLWEHVPFIIRPIDNDLTGETREKYRLRRLEEYNGEQYWAYYAMVIDIGDSVPHSYEMDTLVDNTDVTPIETANLTLSSGPPTDQSELEEKSTVLIRTSLNFSISLDENETSELREAVNMYNGGDDPEYSVISEIGLCTGVDRPLDDQLGGTYNEAIECVMHSSSNVGVITYLGNVGFINVTASVFSSEPYYTS